MREYFLFFKKIDNYINIIKNISELNYFKGRILSKEGILNNYIKKFYIDKIKYKNEMSFINKFKKKILCKIKDKKEEIEKKKENIYMDVDVFLPGIFIKKGKRNLISYVIEKINFIIKCFGFKIIIGPEIENELYCFDYLNFPKNHPSRDMQDTFYLENAILRTHTTSIQARYFKTNIIPVKCATYGRVYRNETEDSNHQSMFFQYDLFWIDKNIVIKDLLFIIEKILFFIFGVNVKIRYVPKYYPYTSLSFGIQVNCLICDSIGCNFCNYSGWVTIAGAGEIHKNIILNFNYKYPKHTGVAFGFGIDRIVSRIYKISEVKKIYSIDLKEIREINES